jgi:hypothetical protein
MTIPLFFVAEPVASTGLISIAMEACLDLDDGSFNRNTPGMLVGLLSQSLDSLRKADSLFSADMVIDRLEA